LHPTIGNSKVAIPWVFENLVKTHKICQASFSLAFAGRKIPGLERRVEGFYCLQTQYDITEEAAWHSAVLSDEEVKNIGRSSGHGASTKPKKHFSEI